MSAGTIIMLAVDYEHRFAYPNSTFMYHAVSGWAEGKLKDMEENLEESKRLNKTIWNIYKENTEIPIDKLEELYKCKKDWYLTPEQAKKYKIISKIV
jgi:ATP-dependent protease ClpP protease subunit